MGRRLHALLYSNKVHLKRVEPFPRLPFRVYANYWHHEELARHVNRSDLRCQNVSGSLEALSLSSIASIEGIM